MNRIAQATVTAGIGVAYAGLSTVYANLGQPVAAWLWAVAAVISFVNAVGTAMAWTFDRERRRWMQ